MSTKLVKTEIAIARGKRLRFARGITSMNAEQFGSLCDIGRTTISTWEQGSHALTRKGADKVVRGLGAEGIQCTRLWLLDGVGDPPTIIDQHKLSKLNYERLSSSLNNLVQENHDYYGSQFAQEIELFRNHYANPMIYQIQDETMSPLYRAGDWIGGIRLPQSQLEIAHGLDCIVQLQNGTIVARRIKTTGTGSFKISLYGVNAEFSVEHPPFRYLLTSQVQALAPIIRVWRPYVYAEYFSNTMC